MVVQVLSGLQPFAQKFHATVNKFIRQFSSPGALPLSWLKMPSTCGSPRPAKALDLHKDLQHDMAVWLYRFFQTYKPLPKNFTPLSIPRILKTVFLARGLALELEQTAPDPWKVLFTHQGRKVTRIPPALQPYPESRVPRFIRMKALPGKRHCPRAG